jgi:hypothetical protein
MGVVHGRLKVAAVPHVPGNTWAAVCDTAVVVAFDAA